jgi:hypothetical protein
VDAFQMNTQMIERLIRFQHPEKVLGYLGRLDDERIAALFGLDLSSYQQLRQSHEKQARSAAADLLDDSEFARKVDRLPFAPGQRVVAVGESTTDDLLSWFEILRHLLDLRRPFDGITLTNAAVSGHTSTQALTTLPGLSFHRPDWVLCMLGGNDAPSGSDRPTDQPWSASLKPNATYAACGISPSGPPRRDGCGSPRPQSTRLASRPRGRARRGLAPRVVRSWVGARISDRSRTRR